MSQSQDKRGDIITWTLVGSSLDKKRVHEQETKSVDSPPLKKKPRKKNEPPPGFKEQQWKQCRGGCIG